MDTRPIPGGDTAGQGVFGHRLAHSAHVVCADRRGTVILGPRTLSVVRTQRQVVDYALQRRTLLADVHAGRVGTSEVCDANPYLLRAAKFHGEATDVACPVCRKEQLTRVSWVYGDEIKHMAGSARTPDELNRMATVFAEFTVHVVEVCRTCSWNHLVQSYVLGTGGVRAPGNRRKTAAE